MPDNATHRPGVFAVYPSLRDRVVLVTGGGSGIGASMVEQFAAQGARVAFLDIDCAASTALVERLAASAAHTPRFMECDLTDIPALRAAVAGIEAQLGAVRVLVNNAANDDRHRFEDVTPEYWDERLAVNLKHQYFAAQAVAPAMAAAGGGSMINMSSLAWLVPQAGMPVYTVAKAGVMGLTRTLAAQLGPANIRVNCVLPGAITTERQRRLWLTPKYVEGILARQLIKRLLEPDEVARLVLSLAADDSSAMTAHGYVIDGGGS
jgi:D-xylose 1-dehydrogenase